MDILLQDIRYAIRQLARSPGFTAVVVLTLALGIGLNVAVFALVNGIMLRPLPVERPEQLVQVFTSEWSARGAGDRPFGATSYPDYADFGERSRSFAGLMGYTAAGFWLRGDGERRLLTGAYVSGNYFQVLGTRPALGRFFTPDEDQRGAPAPVVVLSHALWRSEFGGDSSIIGRPIGVNDHPLTVIGVARPEALGMDTRASAALFIPFALRPLVHQDEELDQRGARGMRVIGRLAPGVTAAAAEQELGLIMDDLARLWPEHNANRVITVTSARTLLGEGEESPVAARIAGVALGVTFLVLCIAVLNVASLFVARATRRRRELAVRLSLGAGRGRILRQFVTEASLLAVAAAGLAAGAASWLSGLAQLIPLPGAFDFGLDLRVLGFTAGLALFTAVGFGLAPAAQVLQPALTLSLKGGETGPGHRGRLRRLLVSGQVALSIVLLVAAGLLVRSLLATGGVAPGFDTRNVLTARLLHPYDLDGPAVAEATERAMERVRTFPGVRSVAVAGTVPLRGGARRYVTIPGYEPRPGEDMEIASDVVSPGYFPTLGIPIVRGRDFSPTAGPAPPEVIVNETMARRYWADGNPVGRLIHLGNAAAPAAEIVGVARNAKYRSLNEEDRPYFYIQWPAGGLATALHLRFDTPELAGVAGAVRGELQAAAPRATVTDLRTLEDVLRASLIQQRVSALAVTGFGLLAITLAALGLYGLQAYAVAERRREIGLRIALGADAQRVVGMVLRQGVARVAVGAAAGIPLALLGGRVVAQALHGVSPADPLTYAGVLALLVGVALAASWIPARRAARVDPAVALREE